MKISEEDFAQLGLTDKDIASAITESVYQAYKESPNLRRLKKTSVKAFFLSWKKKQNR